MRNRIEYQPNGKLDEVVTDGGAHLERMAKNRWFLECARSDGSSFSVWFTGEITMMEEREKPNRK